MELEHNEKEGGLFFGMVLFIIMKSAFSADNDNALLNALAIVPYALFASSLLFVVGLIIHKVIFTDDATRKEIIFKSVLAAVIVTVISYGIMVT